jgi:hypothetical protein
MASNAIMASLSLAIGCWIGCVVRRASSVIANCFWP